MLTKTPFRILLALAVTAACIAPAHAENASAALAELAQMDRPFHSRTCGLVLLSDGRALARVAKASAKGDAEAALAQLMRAFFLLRDGREVKAGLTAPRDYFTQRLSTGRTAKPFNQALPEATKHCEQWFDARRGQPDFDLGAEAKASASEQAELTFRTE